MAISVKNSDSLDEDSPLSIEKIEQLLHLDKCFTVKDNFDSLLSLGFIKVDKKHHYATDNSRDFLNICHLIEKKNHDSFTNYDHSFYKIVDNEVVELYFKDCENSYSSKKVIPEYYLCLKGQYHLDTLKLISSKKPSLIGYNWFGKRTLVVTVRGPETEWYLTDAVSQEDCTGKYFYSDLHFGLSRVEYNDNKHTISEVYFKLGGKILHSETVGEVVPDLKNCSYLKLLNWKKYVTQEHICLLEMLHV